MENLFPLGQKRGLFLLYASAEHLYSQVVSSVCTVLTMPVLHIHDRYLVNTGS